VRAPMQNTVKGFDMRTMPDNRLSKYFASPRCPSCGLDMRLRWRVEDPQSAAHDLRQFFCSCGAQFGDKVPRESGHGVVAHELKH